MNNLKTLDAYWEQKTYINFEEEIEKYEKICGLRYKKKVVYTSYPKESYLVSYNEWKQNIVCTISILDINELEEYSRFLNQKIRDNEVIFNLAQSLIIPFSIFMLGDLVRIIMQPLNELTSDIFTLLKFVMIAFMYGCIFFKSCSVREESIYRYFYEDVKSIVDEKIMKEAATLRKTLP